MNIIEIDARIDALEKIRDKEEDISHAKAKWLQDQGWERSSSNPACLWLWAKEIDTTQYRGVTTTIALDIESSHLHLSGFSMGGWNDDGSIYEGGEEE